MQDPPTWYLFALTFRACEEGLRRKPTVTGRPLVMVRVDGHDRCPVAAVALVEKLYGAPAIAAEVMATDEFDLRQGFAPIVRLVFVSEAAELLGVSRQWIAERSLPVEP